MQEFRSHCGYCGAKYPQWQLDQGPAGIRDCSQCSRTTWFNPTPISVMLQPVYSPALEVGLLIGKRGISPQLGEWGLPGGFVGPEDESYEHAATRELGEEVYFSNRETWASLLHPPTLFYSRTGDWGQMISFCVASRAIPEIWLESFLPGEECPEVDVMWGPQDLCFSSHTEAALKWFTSRKDLALSELILPDEMLPD